MDLGDAVAALQSFGGADLTPTLARIERSLRGATIGTCTTELTFCGASAEVLSAAALIKHLAGEINVVIHAAGILLCLPKILQPGEVIEYVSLGAGNTGRPFDLETNQRIAEFKFIWWQGGAEAIRQNALFKDFYLMAEHESEKRKYLYVLGREYPLKFLNGGRAISSVLSGHAEVHRQFSTKFADQYRTVRDYYSPRKDAVAIEDISEWVPQLIGRQIDSDESAVNR